MHFVNQSDLLPSIRLLLGWCESSHPHLLGILRIINIGPPPQCFCVLCTSLNNIKQTREILIKAIKNRYGTS